jgi:predicted O-linked N-acetylglucosamine transferase (SPINDLY family)
LLAPFNPGWVARSQALVFDRQLEEMAEALQIDRSRIHVMGELNVAEAESALALCDIYLNPFPHGGATMTHLALINGKPPVTLRRQSSRAIDQFLIQSIGIHEVLAKTPDEYIRIVTSLAQNATARRALSEKIREAARTPPFVDNPAYSQSAQALIDQALTRLSRRKPTHA